ncbi:MAG: cupin domain-containing protein [Candidatus Limnocylindria bacterium]
MRIYRSESAEMIEPPGHFGGLTITDVVDEATGGNFRVQLSVCPPGSGGERHAHDDEKQLFVIVRGQLSFFLDGQEPFTLRERDGVLLSPGEYHATKNESDEETVALVVTVRQ